MPKKKTEVDKTCVWIPKSLHKVLKQKALDENKSMERVLTDVLKANLKKSKKIQNRSKKK